MGEVSEHRSTPAREPVIRGAVPERRSFTSIVTAMVMLLLAIGSFLFPAGYLIIHMQYQHGQVNSESEVNASFLADLLEEQPAWQISNPALERFVKEDAVFMEAGAFESRAILGPDHKVVFASKVDHPLGWPLVSEKTPIVVDNETRGYYLIERSLAHVVIAATGVFFLALLGSALIAYLLHRYVLVPLRAAEDDLSRQARFDALTGLPNRREALLELERRLAHQEHRATAVFFIDLDKFKLVNDSYGHAVGDEVLRASAHRLRHCIRPEDFLGRLSGDEFIIFLSPGEGEALIRRVSEAVKHAFSLSQMCLGHEVAMTATVGIALAPLHGNTPEQLMQRADTAMYSLKADRRGGWKLYEPAMTATVDREVQLRAKLKQALQREEFELHYQPIVRFSEQRVIGAEALLRWRDSATGLLVEPDDFITELELSGLIVPVGEWVLRAACRQVVEWRKTLPRFHIAVNVSARQFVEDGFVELVARILSEENAPPEAIAIELTESMLLDDALTCSRLEELKALGIWLGLDDFGTGYSSLGRLASMPFDVIKIDREFIERMNEGPRQRSVVVSILALSHGLGMKVVAEGIEQADQREALIELGCEQGQGFLFSRPIPADLFRTNFIGTDRQFIRAYRCAAVVS